MNKKIPKDYFNKFPDRLSSRIEALEENIKESAPLLYKIGKAEPYQVPATYFDQLKAQIEKQTSGPKERKIGLYRWSSIAAIGALLVAAILVFSLQDKESEDGLMANRVIEHIENDLDYVDDELLYELVTLEETEELSEDLDLSEQEIELYFDYILDDMTDEELSDLL